MKEPIKYLHQTEFSLLTSKDPSTVRTDIVNTIAHQHMKQSENTGESPNKDFPRSHSW